jgi:hypothetical protein
VLGSAGRFVHIQRADGQAGYIPNVLCRHAAPAGARAMVQVVQPVALYAEPEPGSQYDSRWIVPSDEDLLVLGKDGRFVLVQRADGLLGYVPAVVCGEAGPSQLFKIGPVDLGWIVLGCGWMWLNWAGVALALVRPVWIDAPLRPYLGLGVVLGVAALLWFGGRRRPAARSFALGVLAAYALLHLVGGGALTLWK